MEHPGAYLRTRFMVPLALSPSELARRIAVPRSRLSEILSGRRAITPDTANRLALFFGVAPAVFLSRQMAWDLARLAPVDIEPADTTGYLVGPLGITPIPSPRGGPAPRSISVPPDALERLRAMAASTPAPADGEWEETVYPSGQRALEQSRR